MQFRPGLSRKEPENSKVHDKERGKEEDKVLSFSFCLCSKPVDKGFYPGKKTAGRDDGDNAGIEKVQHIYSLRQVRRFLILYIIRVFSL